jgi:hypothetical protein
MFAFKENSKSFIASSSIIWNSSGVKLAWLIIFFPLPETQFFWISTHLQLGH